MEGRGRGGWMGGRVEGGVRGEISNEFFFYQNFQEKCLQHVHPVHSSIHYLISEYF